MLPIHFTLQHLDDYYNNRLHEDLNRFFKISKEDNIDVVTGFKEGLYSVFHYLMPVVPAASHIKEQGHRVLDDSNLSKREPQKENEERILFVALISFMFSAEQVIVHRFENYSESELASCMNAFGFPWLKSIHRITLADFLSLDAIKSEFFNIEVVEMLRDAMSIVEPFMLDKLITFLKTWDNGSFYLKNTRVGLLGAYIESSISKGLLRFYRRGDIYKYKGLTGLQMSHKEYSNYKQHFFADFKKYFSCASEKDGYLEVLYVSHSFNNRYDDGNPGGSISNNFIFSCIFLYMVIVQQSIMKHAKEVEFDFHKCTGWPMISSGPGAGPYLHPLLMLDYAGLSPLKHESLILLEYTKKFFPYLRQEINTVLNGNESAMKDVTAGKRFLDALKGHGHKKALIHRYLDDEVKVVQDLLCKWHMYPGEMWNMFLEKEGVPIQKEI